VGKESVFDLEPAAAHWLAETFEAESPQRALLDSLAVSAEAESAPRGMRRVGDGGSPPIKIPASVNTAIAFGSSGFVGSRPRRTLTIFSRQGSLSFRGRVPAMALTPSGWQRASTTSTAPYIHLRRMQTSSPVPWPSTGPRSLSGATRNRSSARKMRRGVSQPFPSCAVQSRGRSRLERRSDGRSGRAALVDEPSSSAYPATTTTTKPR
jgi:hypothetical protein